MTVIPIVQGNLLRLGIALQVVKITSVEGVVDKQVEDFVPNPNFPVKVLLTRGSMVCEFTATMEGNVAVIEDKGTIHVGKYALTVLCRDDDGNPMRFKQKDAVNIVDLTAEAGIVPGAEFETGTQWLDGAVFLSLTAQGGGGTGEETDPIFSASPAAGITTEDINKWDGKQDALTFDNAPTDNSTNMVRSGGIKAYVDNMIVRLQRTIDVITQGDDTQDIIDTFNEVVDFLAGIDTDDPTLFNQLKGLDDAITALQRAYDGLATVATSGDYRDLSHKPTIPDAQVQSDWDAVSGMGVILNKPTNLSDFVNDMGFARIIYGHIVNGSFFKGTYSGGQWRYEANAVTPATGVLYIDVADNVSYVWSGSAYARVDEEQTETPSVTVSATGDVSQALNPNTFYRFGAVDSLDLTLVAGTGLVVYFGRFSTSANWGGTGLTVPSGVTEGANNPTVEASKTYEFNIMDNVLLLMEV